MDPKVYIIAAALLVSAGCTQFPDLDNRVTDDLRQTSYPDLIPLDGVLAQQAAAPATRAQTEDAVLARLAALRARADALRAPVIDAPTRTRLEEGVKEG